MKALGATHVVDRHADEDALEEAIRAIVGDTLVYAIDCVNGTEGSQTLGARVLSNSQKGTLVIMVHSGTVDEARLPPAKRGGKGYERKGVIAAPAMFPEEAAAYWKHVPRWI